MRTVRERTGSMFDAVDLTLNSRISAWLHRIYPSFESAFHVSDKAGVMCRCLCRVNWELCAVCTGCQDHNRCSVLRPSDSCHHADDSAATPPGPTGCTGRRLSGWIPCLWNFSFILKRSAIFIHETLQFKLKLITTLKKFILSRTIFGWPNFSFISLHPILEPKNEPRAFMNFDRTVFYNRLENRVVKSWGFEVPVSILRNDASIFRTLRSWPENRAPGLESYTILFLYLRPPMTSWL